MKPENPTYQELETQLARARDILTAIQQGQVDVIVGDDRHMQLLTLKQTIDMLRENERNFRALADANLIGIGFGDSSGNITYINDEMLRMTGYSRADLLAGRINWETCLAPENRPEAGTWSERLSNQEVVSVQEWAFLRPDGGRTQVLGASSRISSPDGRHVIIALDLTQMRQAETRTWKSDQRLRMAADSLNIGIFEWNLTKETAFWENDQMYRIFGRSRKLPPLSYSDFLEQAVDLRDKKNFARAFSKAQQPGNSFAFACRIHRPDQSTVPWIEITGRFYRDDADLSLCMIGIAKDISHQKQYEHAMEMVNDLLEQRVRDRTARIQNQAERMRVLANKLGQVEQKERNRLAAVLHDHIQPLVVGARMHLWDIHRKKDIGAAHKTAHKIETILEETLAELRSLTVDLSPSAILNDGLAGGIHWLVAYMKKKFDFTLKPRVDDTIDPIAENTCFLLFQCTKELLFNVVKHSGETHAAVSIGRTQDQKIKVIVSDNGRGFAPETFEETQNHTTSLGLFSIEERLKDIGGRMEIASTPGQGTAVTLTAPAGETDEAVTTAATGHNRRADDKPGRPVRNPEDSIGILIVDDHKLLREGLTGLLQMEPDFAVLGEAADADTAVALAQKLEPDVVIMDVNLGETNGMDATRQILSTNPHTKVIALSMHRDKKVMNAMYAAGAAVFLNKTVPSDVLIANVRGCISEN
ncbi:MAG: response regulator [Desulfotignum sp.]|jgi:PAS domain S-box-containing protein|nr:response regulator [Desulfotignum sp.]